ncbi:unnamed protein product [Clonostachys solani]|uniref:F-box domain-containing protein n=1 Tax=Clonostachys solani TaxID=160281 RepID=A0A9N9W6X4_9HYPO|nr:unnamed protein product [Clonostachys solani]
MAQDNSLCTLPPEMRISIADHLDAKSLLALSLTCTLFRRLIELTSDQRLQILLQLELLDRYGGEMRIYGQRPEQGGERFATAQQIADWGRFRWACSGCVRLLPHLEFDNRSIFGRPYQKPVHARPSGHIWSWDSRPDEDGADAGKNVVGRQLLGSGEKRHLRQCNECLSQRSSSSLRYVDEFYFTSPEFEPPFLSPRIPVAKSRRIRCASAINRFFPGFLDFLSCSLDESKEVPSKRAMRYLGYHSRLSTVPSFKCYILRCPSCERWKELRSFPVPCSVSFWSLDMESVREWLFVSSDRLLQFDEHHPINFGCMACLAAKENGHDSMAEVVLTLFKGEIDIAIRAEEQRLQVGWRAMTEFIKSEWPESVRQELEMVRENLNEIWHDEANVDMQQLGNSRGKLRDFMDEVSRDASFRRDCCSQICPRSTVAAFVKYYDAMDEEMNWLHEAKAAVEAMPELLLNWALDPQNMDKPPWDQPDLPVRNFSSDEN